MIEQVQIAIYFWSLVILGVVVFLLKKFSPPLLGLVRRNFIDKRSRLLELVYISFFASFAIIWGSMYLFKIESLEASQMITMFVQVFVALFIGTAALTLENRISRSRHRNP